MITTAASLFDGIGGFPLALTRAGVELEATVEIDSAAAAVAARNLPPHKQFSDIREVTGADLLGAGFDPSTGIITAGWPCQGNSVAGRRGGMDDPRSGLWWEVVRLIRETRPQWFLGENVRGLLSVHGGRDFGFVKESLERLGYGLAWRVLDAQYFGVPQRRKRVFIVACLGDGAGPAEVLLEPTSVPWDSAPGVEASRQDSRASIVGTLAGGGRRGYRIGAEDAANGMLLPVPVRETGMRIAGNSDPSKDSDDVGGPADPSYTLRVGGTPHGVVVPFNFHQSSGICAGEDGDPSYTLAAHHGQQVAGVQTRYAVRRLTPLECERLQGFPDGWTDGQSDARRYQQLGNAVAVPCVEWIVRRIVAVDSTSNREAA